VSLVTMMVILRSVGFIPQSWYYAPLMGVAAVALNGALGTLPVPRARASRSVLAAVPTAMVAIVAALTWGSARSELETRQTNIDLVAARLGSLAAAQDIVLVNPWPFGVSFQRYYRGPAPWETIPVISRDSIHRYDLVSRTMLAAEPIDFILFQIERTLRAGHRVWVVGLALPAVRSAPPPTPPTPDKAREGGKRHQDFLSWWERQAGFMVATHATSAEPVEVRVPDPVSTQENASLSVHSGWVDQAR
jgi:hypothetical protein